MNILYVVGRGHSGTTILDLVLGKAFGFRSCGELISGLSRFPDQECTCGKRMQDCDTWAPALSVIEDKHAIKGQGEQRKFFQLLSSYATIFSLLKFFFLLRKAETKKALDAEKDFIDAVGTGWNGVVDSSKELGRAWVLARGPAQASWIHIYRNPAQVAGSYRFRVTAGKKVKIYRRLFTVKPYMLPVLDLFVALSWSVWTMLTVVLGAVSPKKYSCVKYEDFFLSPYKHVVAVSKKQGVSIVEGVTEDSFCQGFSVGHIVGGNRLTENKEVSVKNSGNTSRKTPLVTMVICYVVCFPAMIMAELAYYITTKRRLS